MKKPEEMLKRGEGNFLHCTDYEDAIDAIKEYGQQQALKFFEWIFEECSTDAGHFPHELGFWHKETQKYLTTIELYDLFISTKCAVGGN